MTEHMLEVRPIVVKGRIDIWHSNSGKVAAFMVGNVLIYSVTKHRATDTFDDAVSELRQRLGLPEHDHT